MKVSEFLKKVVHISGAGIRIEFKADKQDEKTEVESLNEYTPAELADQIIRRAAEYTLQEVVIVDSIVFITAVRTAKRTPKPKPDKVPNQRREEQKQAIAKELERLDQAVAVLIKTIAAPLRRIGQWENRKRGRTLAILKSVRAAVRRILTRIFRKGRNVDV